MSLRSAIVGQFRRPHGVLGHVAGFVMARRPSNRERNAWTVELLRLEPHHAVLEIGCGPGLALAACAGRLETGRVIGIDHSQAMVSQARRRLAADVRTGRAEVRLGSLAGLGHGSAAYDRVFSLNVVQFLPDMEEGFRQIHACLAAGGMAATTFQPRSRTPRRAEALAMADRIEEAMQRADFTEMTRHELPFESAPAICVTGIKLPREGDATLVPEANTPGTVPASAGTVLT